MPSPFPGMNPYLEHPFVWPDFHDSFLLYLREALAPLAGPRYSVRAKHNIYVQRGRNAERELIGQPDVGVSERPGVAAGAAGRSPLAVLDPVEVIVPTVGHRRSVYLEVRNPAGNRVVTVIELLSPSNKAAGADRDQYLLKRQKLLASRVGFVELDLLRGGRRVPLRNRPASDYYALVSRPGRRPRADLWPVRLRDRLPPIPIPLDAGEPEAVIGLQEVLHRTHDGGSFAPEIYAHAPRPPLSPEDAEWARGVLAGVTPPG